MMSEPRDSESMEDRPGGAEARYVWAVEWDNPFNRENPRGMVLYDVALLPGVTEEEFATFLAEEGFAAVEGILTRAIRFKRQYLLRYSDKAGPDPLGRIQKEGVPEKLASLCRHTADSSFNVLMASGTSSEE